MTATEVADGSHENVDGGSGTKIVTPVNDETDSTKSAYHLKWIHWNSGKIPIVMQSINGPCPLIATMNVLLLREKVKLPSMLEQITADQLLTYLGESIMDSVPSDIYNDDEAILNLEQHIHDAMEILPKLKTGLDVNIRFTGITDFEYTPECIIFDLLRIPLYHGWLSDPSIIELQNAIGNQSYNQLVDSIITNKNSTRPEDCVKVLIAEEFLERTASQLTQHGLNELKSKIKDNEIGILFRNNHFLTLFKRENEIYTLVTDHGYLTEDNVIWETLDNIEGAGRFFDSNFEPSEITNRQVSEFNTIDQRNQQLENDFLIALSLKEDERLASQQNREGESSCSHDPEDDFELAKRLQAEEDKLYNEMSRSTHQMERWTDPNDRAASGNKRDIDHHSHELKKQNQPSNLNSRTTTTEPITSHQQSSLTDLKDSKDVDKQQLTSGNEPSDIITPSTSSSAHTAQVSSTAEAPSSTTDNPRASSQPPPPLPTSSLQQTQRSSSTSSSSSHRGIKSEKNSKETNCIVN